ncbi:MAG: glycosyl hydrolase family 8 [Umezawaea sp.]
MNRAVRALAVSVALVGGVVTAGGGAQAAVGAAAYVPGTIRPSVAQSTQDTVLTKYYAFWKANFLTTKCGTGTYAVLSKDADHSFVAEGEGYGMTIAALMANKDPDARKIFDGILKFVKAHPSVNDKDLHAAEQDANCKSVNGSDSATDGDLEIAYGLLIADKQWGSTGSVDYKAEAVRIINGIKRAEVNNSTKFPLLGDWGDDAQYKNSSRSSDWMPGHLRAFKAATGDAFWDQVRTRQETAVTQLQSQYAPNTGLLPDFVVNTNSTPKPAPADFLESEYDGKYSWNACRDPWRLGVDAVTVSGSAAKAQVAKMTTWIKSKTGGDPAKIGSGYTLAGAATETGEHPCFTAPFAVAAMSDPGSQAWLDKLWARISTVSLDSTDYYGTGIQVQVLIILTGNFVAP